MSGSIDTWFNSMDRLASVAVSAVLMFVLIVVMARIAGKRTTGQMNNFDWIITVTVGSLGASGILLKDVSILDAALAVVIVFGLQWLVTWLVLKSETVARLVKSKPTLLIHKGKLLENELRRERVSEAELRTELRRQGMTGFEEANWVVIENDGSMTVIPRKSVELHNAELMQDVESKLS